MKSCQLQAFKGSRSKIYVYHKAITLYEGFWKTVSLLQTFSLVSLILSLVYRVHHDFCSMQQLQILQFENRLTETVEHKPPKLVGWVRILVGSCEDLNSGTCGLSRLVLSINGWAHGKALRAAMPLNRHQRRIHCETSHLALCGSKWRWAPQTTRDTPKGVPRKQSINETESLHLLFAPVYALCNVYVRLKCFIISLRNPYAVVTVPTLRSPVVNCLMVQASGSQTFLHVNPQLNYTIFCRPRVLAQQVLMQGTYVSK